MKDPQNLLVIESPNKRPKIEGMFPDTFKVIATGGHICDLPESPKEGIGIDRPNMKGQYELSDGGKRTLSNIKKYIKENPGAQVYLGTDPDREGESIGAFVALYAGLRGAKRMRFNAITPAKIEEAHRKATEIDWRAVQSREARRLIDRIIGYVATPALRTVVRQKGASAGRVQTAVEALVIERERKIRGHKPQTHYTVHADLGGWTADWKIPAPPPKQGVKTNAEFDIEDTAARCYDQATAQRAAASTVLAVKTCESTEENRLPPPPLNTIALIQVADKVLGWDADTTMKVAQKLFEGDGAGHGHITYHRTDSPNLDPEAAEEIRAWLRKLGQPVGPEANVWKCKNAQAQEGHEAIRPVVLEAQEAGATDEQRALYRLIRERAVYSQLAPARYAVRQVVLTDVSGTFTFTATARTLIDPGWLATPAAKAGSVKGEEDPADAAAIANLPNLKPGMHLPVTKNEIRPHTTKQPPRYTLNTLTAKLEKLCIGRPGTIASILKNIQHKGTIKVIKDRQLQATPLAEQCYDILYPRFGFAHIGYTAELELALDQIASGHIDGSALVRMVWDRLDADCAALVAAHAKLAGTAA